MEIGTVYEAMGKTQQLYLGVLTILTSTCIPDVVEVPVLFLL